MNYGVTIYQPNRGQYVNGGSRSSKEDSNERSPSHPVSTLEDISGDPKQSSEGSDGRSGTDDSRLDP